MELRVEDGCPPTRLDRYLARHVPSLSRRALRRFRGKLFVNDRAVPRSTLVRPGDRIRLPDELLRSLEPPRAELPELRFLYDDGDLFALDKPPGIPTVQVAGGDPVSLASGLLGRWPELGSVGSSPGEAGLVHRLDRGTSGVVLGARKPELYRELREAFRRRSVRKEYWALVEGDVAGEGCVSVPLVRGSRRGSVVRPARRGERGRPAETRFLPVVRYGKVTLLRVTISTGVLHQVRVHLASVGHPVVGDERYGATRFPRLLAPGRHALHATRIEFDHPSSRERIAVESPLPDDLSRALQEIRTKGERSGG
ncbi:MAG: pseudouridine synthase [Candidatus Binatia bacterium]|nr:MAG: pseudouridine synthase [Candidatus Binatia bacterium]